MTFCTECGQDHHAGEREEQAALDREVEMERLRTKRDVEVARINAGVVRDVTEEVAETELAVAEVEAVAGTEAAEAVADALTAVVTPEPAAPAEPVVIEAPEPEPEAEGEVLPPPAKEHEHSGGYGSSAWFAGR